MRRRFIRVLFSADKKKSSKELTKLNSLSIGAIQAIAGGMNVTYTGKIKLRQVKKVFHSANMNILKM